MSDEFQVTGQSAAALFSLKVHRGDGMALLGMNWKGVKPPLDFVGFAIEYKEPGGTRFFALKNRIAFAASGGAVNPNRLSTMLSPIQKFRWVHFARNAELPGDFVYKVTPVFMNAQDELSYGESQEAAISLRRETYPGQLNVTFTRGFVSSQAFVDRYASGGQKLEALIPAKADDGLTFVPTHPQAKEALAWMGFEARDAILELLDEAIADKTSEVCVVAYDLCEPEVVSRLKKLKKRLRIIIDDSGHHAGATSAESQATAILTASAGAGRVKRQHMSNLQHNKTIVVKGAKVQAAVCGSTNFTWRGFYVQSNNAVIVRGPQAIQPFLDAFENYWRYDSAKDFGKTPSAEWIDLGLAGIDAKICFSPHSAGNARLADIAADVGRTKSSLFYSLAFLYQTKGPIRDAIEAVSKKKDAFVYGISDRRVGGGLDLQKPDGNVSPVRPEALVKNVPEPFKSEPTGLAGGVGNRMHHKFLVIDFDKPEGRVYFGSYNFSNPADRENGENLLVIRDRRVAVSYMIEAVRLFDHYHFRVLQKEAAKAKSKLMLRKPPRKTGEKPWWAEDYTNARKIRDRELFS